MEPRAGEDTTMPSMAEEAEYLRLGLVAEVVSPLEVVSWADVIIARLEDPPYPLLEVSLSPVDDPHEISRRLRVLTGGDLLDTAATRPLARVLSLLRVRLDAGQLTHREVVSTLVMLGREARELPKKEADFFTWVDDEFDLAEAGYIDMAEAKAALEEFLGGYSATSLHG